jgi:hypothetical protein
MVTQAEKDRPFRSEFQSEVMPEGSPGAIAQSRCIQTHFTNCTKRNYHDETRGTPLALDTP